MGPLKGKAPSSSSLPEGYSKGTKLGIGSFGEVWKAWDTRLQKYVALKKAIEADRQTVESFREECDVSKRLHEDPKAKQDPEGASRVIECFDAHLSKKDEEIKGEQYITMEMGGEDLEKLYLSLSSTEEKRSFRLEALRQLSEGLRLLKSLGMGHRDLKAQNVVGRMVPRGDGQGQTLVLKMIDFGFMDSVSDPKCDFCYLWNEDEYGAEPYAVAPPEMWCVDKAGKPDFCERPWAKNKFWSYDVWSLGMLHLNLYLEDYQTLHDWMILEVGDHWSKDHHNVGARVLSPELLSGQFSKDLGHGQGHLRSDLLEAGLPEDEADVVLPMVSYDPAKRPSPEKLLELPLIRDVDVRSKKRPHRAYVHIERRSAAVPE